MVEDTQKKSGHKPRWGLLGLQSLESNPQLSFATRMEDWILHIHVPIPLPPSAAWDIDLYVLHSQAPQWEATSGSQNKKGKKNQNI